PIHGDVWSKNIIKTNDEKLYFIDWEYAHMGDIHFELAYIIESYNFSKEQEDVLLEEYKDYSDELLKKHKILINYLTILWAYSQNELPYDIKPQIKKLENLSKQYL
ncbi:MAG: phosphotransferase, partial [Mycoplasmataceae bacterium]|nr:phosphotransferase [Mycoplasmataceae bacterium]